MRLNDTFLQVYPACIRLNHKRFTPRWLKPDFILSSLKWFSLSAVCKHLNSIMQRDYSIEEVFLNLIGARAFAHAARELNLKKDEAVYQAVARELELAILEDAWTGWHPGMPGSDRPNSGISSLICFRQKAGSGPPSAC
jgi:hypothetical protein